MGTLCSGPAALFRPRRSQSQTAGPSQCALITHSVIIQPHRNTANHKCPQHVVISQTPAHLLPGLPDLGGHPDNRDKAEDETSGFEWMTFEWMIDLCLALHGIIGLFKTFFLEPCPAIKSKNNKQNTLKKQIWPKNGLYEINTTITIFLPYCTV